MSETVVEGLIPMETIDRAATMLLAAAPQGSEVILFGSYARGDADCGSDVDFMVVEPAVAGTRTEAVRLRQAVRPLRIPMDVLVVSRERFNRWRTFPSTVIAQAAREGKVYRDGT